MNVEEQILEGKIDVAIIYESSERPNVKYDYLFQDEIFAIVPADHPWTKKSFVEAKDFEGQNIIIHSFPLESVSLFSQLLIPEGINPKNVM